ncbi:hypothetical protein [Paenibacillus koleovorans]|uniref:hypothetical protein n=1 Tax=Paenibacillus koleovorans TaxID=121608 RepID=UPI000FD9AD24|nr:hypothetical protein [Paenibacillus koleovorans]
MKPIRYPQVKAQPLSGMLPPQSIREFRGVNSFDPYSIAENYFTDMLNMTSDDYPTASVRPGYTVLGSAIGTKVLGMGVWKDTELHAVFQDGTWRKWSGSAWSTLKSGLNTTAMWSFTNFQGNLTDVNLVGCNGVDGLHRYDGSTVQTFGDAPTNINYITTYQNRLWGASGKELHACKLDQPASWNDFGGTDEDSFAKDMESTRGENINMLSGSLSKLTIGMPNSLHELYGGLPSDFTVRLITEREGTANNRAAVVQESSLRFMHQTGLFEYLSGGMYPEKDFADIVEGFFRGSISANAVTGTDNLKLYFYDGTSQILVYDPRTGIQAWSIWNGFTPTCFTVFQHKLYIGDASGRVLRLGGAADDAGTPITWSAVTKPYTNPSAAQRQRWIKLWAMMELVSGSTVNVSLSKTADGSDWELVHTVTGTGTQIQRILLPIPSNFALANMIRVKFEGTGWARLHELTRQVRQLPLH